LPSKILFIINGIAKGVGELVDLEKESL